MKVKHQDLFIPDDGTDPFINCKLNRKSYAEVLTDIVKNYKDGFVLAINNEWRTGKTTFVKMWRQYLKNQEFQTLYFNAWENDFQNEVIIALLSELVELKNKAEDNFQNILEKAATFFKKVAPSVAEGVAGKAIGKEAVSDIVASITEFTAQEVEKEILEFNNKKKGIHNFRKSLEKFVLKVNDGKPVIFIVDELDRCRPNYAVEVLEQIKHLFSVRGIVFVLSIDKKQLGNAVRGFYGSQLIDADEYLRRFIDLEYEIPKPHTESFIRYLYNYFHFDHFINYSKRSNMGSNSNEKSRFLRTAEMLFSNSDLSLRQMEKIFSRIRLTFNSYKDNEILLPELLVFISFLKLKHNDFCDGIIGLKYNLQEVSNKLDKILTPFIGNANIRLLRLLVAEFLYRYFKDYEKANYTADDKLLVHNKESLTLMLGIQSNFEDDSNILLKYIEDLDGHFESRWEGLGYVFTKYNLIENLLR